MSHGVTYTEMHRLLQEELWEGDEGDILTTLGKVKPSDDDDMHDSIVTFVVTTEEYPLIAYGQVREKNAYSGMILVLELDGEVTHELPFDYPVLAMPSDLSTE